MPMGIWASALGTQNTVAARVTTVVFRVIFIMAVRRLESMKR